MQKPARGLKVVFPTITEQESQELVFKGAVEEMMTDMIRTVRAGVSDQAALLDSIITEVRSFTGQSDATRTTRKGREKGGLVKLQEEMTELKGISDGLCQRLFNLNQQLIQVEEGEFGREKQRMKSVYQNQMTEMKTNFCKEREELQAKLQRYRSKCFDLEDKLARVTEKQKQKASQREMQMNKYLIAIEQLSQEVEKLRKQNQKSSLIQTKQYNREPDSLSNRLSEHFDDHTCSTFSKCPTCHQNPNRPHSREMISQEYYVREVPEPRPQQIMSYCNDTRSVYVPLPNKDSGLRILHREHSPSYQTIVIAEKPSSICGERETRNTSKDRQSTSREKAMKNIRSDYYEGGRGRSNSKGYQEEYLRSQEKEGRMRTVEGKLQGLKRQLQREVRSMKT